MLLSRKGLLKKINKGVMSAFLSICVVMTSFSILSVEAHAEVYSDIPDAVILNWGSPRTLDSGVYCVNSNLEFEGYLYSTPAGLTIAENADVTLYIKEGCTLTCKGADANVYYLEEYFGGNTELWAYMAGAGISVPESSTLTIIGGGSLIATGGNGYKALRGIEGSGGGFEWYWLPSWLGGGKEVGAAQGAGGEGGVGAYSGAAGIGGDGVKGGAGGKGTGTYIWGDHHNVIDIEDIEVGSVGNDGKKGQSGNGMGNVFIADTIKVTATAGIPGNTSGTNKEVGMTYSDIGGNLFGGNGYVVGAGGGSGGAGGSAGISANIGGSGGGGGGGGSGAEGTAASIRPSAKVYFQEKAQAGSDTSSTTGGRGGDSAYIIGSDGTKYVSAGGNGGVGGKGGSGGNLHVTNTVTVNGKKGSPSAIASGLTGANDTSTTTGQKAKVGEAIQVSLDVRLNGSSADDWCKIHKIYLKCADGTQYRMSNKSYSDNSLSPTYTRIIPADRDYTVWADGINTGLVINKAHQKQVLNAYTAKATVNLDDEGYSARKVELYQNDMPKFVLNETEEAGVYTENIFELKTGVKDANLYDVVIDNMYTDKTVTIESVSSACEAFDYYNAQVTVQTDGSPTSEQSVMLSQEGKMVANLPESSTPGVYTKVVYVLPGGNYDYDVFVNNAETGAVLKATSASTMKATVNYYGANIKLNKDDAVWTDATAKLVKKNGASDVVDLKYKDGSYFAMLSEQNGPYELYLYGTGTDADTGKIINKETPTAEINTYTVELNKNIGGVGVYSSRIVVAGATMTEPAAPYQQGFTFEKWSTSAEGGEEYDFANTPINSKTTIYGNWLHPGVFLGTLVRCDADGNIEGGGDYYKMANLSITGFPQDFNSISAVILDYSNVEIRLSEDEDVADIDYGDFEDIAQISTSEKRAIIRFNELQNVNDVEKMVREVIVQPVKDIDSTVQVTVYGKTAE